MRILFSKDTMISPISCREEGMLYLLFLVWKEKVLLTHVARDYFIMSVYVILWLQDHEIILNSLLLYTL